MTEAYYNLLYDVLRAYNRCAPSKVLRLSNDQVFVFGTDAKGIIPPIFRQPLRLIQQKFVPLRKILKSQWQNE